MIQRPPRSTQSRSSAASDVYKRQVIGCLALTGVFTKSEQVVGIVQDVGWQTSVMIEALQTVQRSNWSDQIPAGVDVGDCEYRYAYTDDKPQPISTEVCGTPSTLSPIHI